MMIGHCVTPVGIRLLSSSVVARNAVKEMWWAKL